ncbi:hypothetical protein [Thiosocius teredinicola]|uniref:hypothetical protein n=1 Tax=Thiosocius teredinicola TaxID=1973002 RepID=UPI000990CC72
MSKIIVTASGAEWPASALMELKSLTGMAPAEARAVAAGKPLLERELFGNDHNAVAAALRGVMALDAAAGLGLAYYELEPDEDFSAAPLAERKIDAGVLENILAEADGLYS